MFEMLTGLPPFYTPNREELFQKIKYYALKYPPYLSPNARSLLDGLFQKEPSKRLGSGSGGAEEIKAHPWFHGVDWGVIYRKEVKAPFIPIIKNDVDVSNFDPVKNFYKEKILNVIRNSPKHLLAHLVL